jgi:predicted NBD/HSP70 family sugar kinase
MIGIELDEARAIAVRVDASGGLQARAAVVAEGGDLAAAVSRALSAIDSSRHDEVVGIAAAVPDAPAIAPIVASLAPRVGGTSVLQRAIPSGTAAAAAEAWVGAARGVRDVALFSCAEHTTGGIVRDGVPLTGVHGRAAAVAWLALNPVEREDYRKTGCLEAEVAAAGIVRRLVWRVKSGDRSRVGDAVGGDLAAITLQHVLDAARQSDGVSISVMRDTAKYLGMAAANLVVICDPEMLVLGGIMASAADLLMDPLHAEITRRLPKPTLEALRIEIAALGDDAAAIGAARMAGVSIP